MMKHLRINWVALLLIAAILAGCGAAEPTTPTTEAPASTAPATETTEAPTEAPETTEAPTEQPEETVPETTEQPLPTEPVETEPSADDALAHYINEVYAQQIGRYTTALSEQWEEMKYLDNDLSGLAAFYYEGDPLENVGFGFVDLNGDGSMELAIGAILGADKDPALFELWTLEDGAPVMLAQSGTKNRYYLQFSQEDNAWYVAYEATYNAACNGTYYLMLTEGKFEVMQGIVFNAMADEANPWFMAYDLDWDASNDEPIDEATANAIIMNNWSHYTSAEYIPYRLAP